MIETICAPCHHPRGRDHSWSLSLGGLWALNETVEMKCLELCPLHGQCAMRWSQSIMAGVTTCITRKPSLCDYSVPTMVTAPLPFSLAFSFVLLPFAEIKSEHTGEAPNLAQHIVGIVQESVSHMVYSCPPPHGS